MPSPPSVRRPAWYRRPDDRTLAWVAASAGRGWRVEASSRLRGGIAMAVDAIDLAGPGRGARRLVLKRWMRPGSELEEPGATPSREAAVLDALAGTDVPAPQVVAVDPDGAGAGVPSLLMTHLDGRRLSLAEERRPVRIAALADALARIHALDGPILDVVGPFRPYTPVSEVRAPAASRRPDRWAAAMACTNDDPPSGAAAFLHGDFHPGNTIWRGARLSGVVDWVAASTGPAAVDLAHWRANLGTRHGIEAADHVLAAYRAAVGSTPVDQAWWDIRMLLDFVDDPDALTPADLAGHEAYLDALLARV